MVRLPRIEMDVPNAQKMGDQLCFLAGLLTKNRLITPSSCSSLKEAATKLKKLNNSPSWSYSLNGAKQIEFQPSSEESKFEVIPRLSIEICVNEKNRVTPFNVLTMTLELVDIQKKPISRWHIDKANSGQAGPIFHLQGGGHWRGNTNREIEVPTKLPRWPSPPLDLVLAVEMVIANFFPGIWKESFRGKQSWVELIKESQKLCFLPYFEILGQSTPHSCLEHCWGSNFV